MNFSLIRLWIILLLWIILPVILVGRRFSSVLICCWIHWVSFLYSLFRLFLFLVLGEGEFGKVKLGIHAEFGEEVAVKLIRRNSVSDKTRLSKVEREIQVLRSVNHPHIVGLYDVIETEKYIGMLVFLLSFLLFFRSCLFIFLLVFSNTLLVVNCSISF